MDPNEALRRLRAAIARARQLADGDSNDAEIEAWQEIAEYFQALDDGCRRAGSCPRRAVAGRRRRSARAAGTLADGSPLPVEPLGGPVPGVNGHHLPDVGTWTGDPGTPEYKAETERRIDRYLGRNPDE
jgi:hypothetical protein